MPQAARCRILPPFPRCKAVLNLWAGVEDVTGNPTLNVPLARMVDHGLTCGMVEWVVGHTLRHHLDMDAHLYGQNSEWRKAVPPLAENRCVTLLGLGAMGMASYRLAVGPSAILKLSAMGVAS